MACTDSKNAFDLRGLFWPDWLRDHWLAKDGSLSGITEPTVSQVLYALAIANKPTKGMPHMPYTIVETGIRYGASACWLALAANAIEARYYGIEIEKDCVDMVNKLFAEHNLDKCAQAIHGAAPDKAVEMFEQTSVDLFFIDDNHEGPHVKREIEAFWPLLRPGGLMAFHDVIGGFPIWHLVKGLGGIKLVSSPFNQLGQPAFGGLGIARKPVE